jgi:hypothetical protein
VTLGIGASAILRVDDADVHIAYTEVTIDNSFVLGCGWKDESKAEKQ